MAKNMARLDNGIVVNIEWCSDSVIESDVLKNLDDRPVAINDTYNNGKFYRDGVEILTPLEEAQKSVIELENKEQDLVSSYQEGINSI